MSPLKGSFEKSFVGNSLRESIGLRESVGFRESVANSISPSQPDKASNNQEYQEVVVEENEFEELEHFQNDIINSGSIASNHDEA